MTIIDAEIKNLIDGYKEEFENDLTELNNMSQIECFIEDLENKLIESESKLSFLKVRNKLIETDFNALKQSLNKSNDLIDLIEIQLDIPKKDKDFVTSNPRKPKPDQDKTKVLIKPKIIIGKKPSTKKPKTFLEKNPL